MRVNEKNKIFRKKMLLKRTGNESAPVLKKKKFQIEDLYEFPQTANRTHIFKRNSVKTMKIPIVSVKKLSETEWKKPEQKFFINPNLNQNFAVQAYSLSSYCKMKLLNNQSKSIAKESLRVVIRRKNTVN